MLAEMGWGHPDSENAWWLEHHPESPGQRPTMYFSGILKVLYGVSAVASPLPRMQNRDPGADGLSVSEG